jgi:hypothetical protein
MNNAQLIDQSNTLYCQLEKARRMNDHDSAQAICDELSQVNKRLHLIEIQETAERDGKIM